MSVAATILASLAVAGGVFGTLMILVVAMACGANSTPAQIRRIKQVMLAAAVGGVACAAGGIALILKGYAGWGGLVGGSPMVVVFVGMVWVSVPARRPSGGKKPMPEFVPERDKPEWWNRARRLEWEGKLPEAERAIADGVPHAWFAYATADLYRGRMIRLKQQGDAAAAAQARGQAVQWITFYASHATSGGEGTAFSAERDQFLSELPAC